MTVYYCEQARSYYCWGGSAEAVESTQAGAVRSRYRGRRVPAVATVLAAATFSGVLMVITAMILDRFC